jgi:hypothetical protein
MLLAEELLLAALDPERGTVVNSAGQALRVGLSGTLIAELGLSGALVVQDRRFTVTGPPPVDPLLRSVHEFLAGRSGRRSRDQVRRLDRAVGCVWSRVVDRLVAERVLGRRRDRVLFVPVTRHPVLRSELRQAVLERVRAAAAGDGPIDARTAVLLSLSGPCRLLEVVAPDRSTRRHARLRIEQATDLTPVTPAVKAVIAEMQAAATAVAVTAATSAAIGG